MTDSEVKNNRLEFMNVVLMQIASKMKLPLRSEKGHDHQGEPPLISQTLCLAEFAPHPWSVNGQVAEVSQGRSLHLSG